MSGPHPRSPPRPVRRRAQCRRHVPHYAAPYGGFYPWGSIGEVGVSLDSNSGLTIFDPLPHAI